MRYSQTMSEKTQKTPQGEEIPIPKRGDLLKNLRKLVGRKPNRSTPGSPKK